MGLWLLPYVLICCHLFPMLCKLQPYGATLSLGIPCPGKALAFSCAFPAAEMHQQPNLPIQLLLIFSESDQKPKPPIRMAIIKTNKQNRNKLQVLVRI